MKISIVVVSIILVVSVFLPFFIFIINGTSNSSNTKKQINALIKNNGIVYSLKEFWRKNFIGISSDAKILTYINTNASKPNINTINFEDLKLCNILKQFNKDKDGVERLKSLNLELIFKLSTEKNITILFFNIDDDLSEDFELQRIEKWHKLINDAIIKSPIVKLAS